MDEESTPRSLEGVDATVTATQRKRKRFRKLRKAAAKATGSHHFFSRVKRSVFGGSKNDDDDTFSDRGSVVEAAEAGSLDVAESNDPQLLESEETRAVIREVLPSRLKDRSLRRIYAAHNDGYSLDGLSRKCSDIANKPCLIVVSSDRRVFGCFLGSAPFGNVGRITQDSNAASLEAAVFNHSGYVSDTDKLFDEPGKFVVAARTTNFLAIAANAETGGAAIRLNSDLSSGSSEPSPLFASPHLHRDNAKRQKDDEFDVKDVEVYSFEIK